MTRSSLQARCAILLLILLAGASFGQERRRFQWPEKAENLQVLPQDLGGQDLRRVMLGFSDALGVNCYHCHVGAPDKQLVDFDFVSDENPAKTTARTMLKMVRAINDDHLSGVVPSEGERMEVTCNTCHRGVPRPGAIAVLLWNTTQREGVEAAVEQYHELRERHYGRGGYDFSEGMLNGLGYRFLGEGKIKQALAVFRLNVEQFPQASNPWDSLAEAYASQGDTVRAITYYSRSLELDPDNDHAVEQLKKLAGSDSAPD